MNEHETSRDATPEETSLEETVQAVNSSEVSDGEALDVRLKRIKDYLGDALGKVSSLEAMIGATNSDLMLLGYRFKQAIEQALSAEPNSLDQFEELMPAVQTYLKITNQVGRLAQLEHRLSADQVVAKRRLAAVVEGEESAN